MSSVFPALLALLQDPPPEFCFEISEQAIVMARSRKPAVMIVQDLPSGVISASPLRDNILLPEIYASDVAKVAAQAGPPRKRRSAA